MTDKPVENGSAKEPEHPSTQESAPEPERPKVVRIEDILAKSEEMPKKRGRPKKQPPVALTPERIASTFYVLHQAANVVLPGAAITREESLLLGQAIYEAVGEMEAHWLLEWLEKIFRYGSLVGAIALVEWPVIMRVQQNLEARRQAAANRSSLPNAPEVVLQKKRGRPRKTPPKEEQQ